MVRIIGSRNVALDMSAKPSDYFYFTGDTRIVSQSNEKIIFEFNTYYGKQCMVTYGGTNLLNDSQKLDTCSIGYPESGSWIMDWTDIDGRFDITEFTRIFVNKFSNPTLQIGHDKIEGLHHDDTIIGYRGRDTLDGGAGNDIIRAGNGADQITGGTGLDTMYGGFGANDFWDLDDGYADTIYLKSDQFAYNYLYGKAGNSPNGEKQDWLFGVEAHDRVIIQGVPTSALTVEKIGDYIEVAAYGYSEAVFADHSLTLSQAARIVSGELG